MKRAQELENQISKSCAKADKQPYEAPRKPTERRIKEIENTKRWKNYGRKWLSWGQRKWHYHCWLRFRNEVRMGDVRSPNEVSQISEQRRCTNRRSYVCDASGWQPKYRVRNPHHTGHDWTYYWSGLVAEARTFCMRLRQPPYQVQRRKMDWPSARGRHTQRWPSVCERRHFASRAHQTNVDVRIMHEDIRSKPFVRLVEAEAVPKLKHV